MKHEDMAAAFKFLFTAHAKKSQLWIILVIFIVATAINYQGIINQKWYIILAMLLIILILTHFIMNGLTKLFLPIIANRVARKMFSQQKNIKEQYEISWNEHSIEFTSPTSHQIIKFADFLKYLQRDEMIILFQSDHLFRVFPKRMFESEAQMKNLIENVKTANVPEFSPQ